MSVRSKSLSYQFEPRDNKCFSPSAKCVDKPNPSKDERNSLSGTYLWGRVVIKKYQVILNRFYGDVSMVSKVFDLGWPVIYSVDELR